jgi:hypothetical protein
MPSGATSVASLWGMAEISEADMKSPQRRVHHMARSAKQHEVLDLESFLDRMHLGDTVARCAYEVFQSHGSVPNLEVQEDWTKAESERVDSLSRRRAA